MKITNPEWKKTSSATRGGNKQLETIVVLKAEYGCFDKLMGDLHYLGSAKPTGIFCGKSWCETMNGWRYWHGAGAMR